MSGNIEDGTKSRIDTEIDRNWHEFTDLNSSRLHQVGTVLLCTLGRGIGRRSLINKVEWLRGEARCKFPCYASSPLLASFGNVRCVDRVTFRYFQVIRSGGHMQTWQHFQFKCQESLCTAYIGEVITSPVRPGKNISRICPMLRTWILQLIK